MPAAIVVVVREGVVLAALAEGFSARRQVAGQRLRQEYMNPLEQWGRMGHSPLFVSLSLSPLPGKSSICFFSRNFVLSGSPVAYN